MQEYSISDLGVLMNTGELTCKSLVEAYLERIQQIDKDGPVLNSIIELNPDALEIADQLDIELKEKGPRSPLHGIPIILKDNIDTADHMTTTAGSLALEGSIAAQDAGLVTRLRVAGALLLGKANLSEWANFRSNRSSSGWSSRGGQTRNPYALDRNPCGSSSGSAVAVAANLCAAAVGTETDGSIVCPSHANGIVGLKPSIGLVSRAGVIPISHSQDTAGPMGRCVADVAILLTGLVGEDPRDAATAVLHDREQVDYTKFLDKAGLFGARIGVARSYFGYNPQVDAVMETCLKTLQDLGAILVDPANIETEGKFDETEIEVLHYEFKAALNAYLSNLGPGARVHSLQDVIAFNDANKERTMPYFGQERMTRAQAKGPLTEQAYLDALQANQRLARTEGIDATLSRYDLDAIVAPTGGPAWLTDWVNGDHYGGASSSPAAVAGYPNLTVPAGYVYGLPVGISFIGGAFQEAKLLRFGYAFEQARQARHTPGFVPTLDFSKKENML